MKIQLVPKACWRWSMAGIALSMSLITIPVKSADSLDPNADAILKSMSSYLAQTQTLSVNADVDFEVVTRNGQKLQLSSFAKLIMQRPNQLYIHRQGMVADAEFIFDGNTLTLHSNKNNVYAQINTSGTIDDAIRAFEFETGFPAPGADLLFADPYAVLASGVENSAYLGIAYVNGVPCHHLAFREDRVDWQLWVQVGDMPLPMKYVITSRWQVAAPQYEIRLRDWNTNPQIQPGQFSFAAAGAKRLETLPVGDLDEFTATEE